MVVTFAWIGEVLIGARTKFFPCEVDRKSSGRVDASDWIMINRAVRSSVADKRSPNVAVANGNRQLADNRCATRPSHKAVPNLSVFGRLLSTARNQCQPVRLSVRPLAHDTRHNPGATAAVQQRGAHTEFFFAGVAFSEKSTRVEALKHREHYPTRCHFSHFVPVSAENRGCAPVVLSSG